MLPITTPAFVIDTSIIEKNLQILADIKEESGCKIVLALKAYALWHTFPLVGKYLDGCCASGLNEATLAKEEMGKSILAYTPAYQPDEIPQLLEISTHIDFNSISQWNQYKAQCLAHPRYQSGELQFGLRINPEHSTTSHAKYDPCGPTSRLGATKKTVRGHDLTGISGIHFHSLCEQYTDDLEATLEAVDHRFADILMKPHIKWLNIGGGQWITKPDYDRKKLIQLLKRTKDRYDLDEVWMEPGEAITIGSGTLEASVLDIVENKSKKIAILDVSATAHMPDTLEMPYNPELKLSDSEQLATVDDQGEHSYYIGGNSCLAGDLLNCYSFDRELRIGDKLTFFDMAHYTMVKTTSFNGVRHPSIYLKSEQGLDKVREFNYQDFKSRLG